MAKSIIFVKHSDETAVLAELPLSISERDAAERTPIGNFYLYLSEIVRKDHVLVCGNITGDLSPNTINLSEHQKVVREGWLPIRAIL